MRRKTEGLTFPTDPLAAMRDLQNLDAPTDTEAEANNFAETQTQNGAHTTSSTVVLPTSSTEGSVSRPASESVPRPNDPLIGSAVSSKVFHTTSSAVVLPTSSTEGNATDPLRQAVLSLLAQPLAGDPTKGPFTVTSIKVHQQIWERLGHVAGVTGRNKQDLVAEALLDLFVKIRRAEGAEGEGV